MVLTFRPEFAPRGGDRPSLSSIAVERLDRESSFLIFDGIADSTNLAPQLRDCIINRTDGVPLFVEEFTRGPS